MRIRTCHDLASLIRGAREDLGISQESLAERSGVSRKTVNELEVGRSDPLLSNALAVLEALGIPLAAGPEALRAPSTGALSKSGKEHPPLDALDQILNTKRASDDT